MGEEIRKSERDIQQFQPGTEEAAGPGSRDPDGGRLRSGRRRNGSEEVMIWQSIAEEQARIIEKLVKLCKDLIYQLSQYKNIDEEEKRLKELEGQSNE